MNRSVHRLVAPASLLLGGAVGLLLGLAASCSSSTTLNPDHCANNGGDAYCLETFDDGSKPSCSSGREGCATGDRYGCVSAEALDPACHLPCGRDADPACEGTALDSSSGGEVSTSMGPGMTGAEGDTDSSGESGDPCSDASDCTDGAEPFCSASGNCVSCDKLDDPDAACAEAHADRPVCGGNACVACTAAKPEACTGNTPVCGADFECRACEEHSECPQSACHLAGSDRGACFDMDDVEEVATGAALQAALGGLSGSDRAVLRLTGTSYSGVQAEVLNDVEVAIIGDGSAEITGNTGSGLLSVAGNTIMYVSGVTIRANGSGHGITCSGSSVWLDDARVRNNEQAGLNVSGGCEAYLRRTVVRANGFGGVAVNNGSLHARNSAISRNTDGAPGIQAINSTVELTYCTLAGNNHLGGPDSMECLNPSGFVRNSIITGAAVDSVSNCGALTWEGNAIDTAGLGDDNETIGSYLASWFQDPNAGNFRLSVAGVMVFEDIAQWEPGDPVADVDGSPIETQGPSFPGYHQPQ